jgi:hypothetical protein
VGKFGKFKRSFAEEIQHKDEMCLDSADNVERGLVTIHRSEAQFTIHYSYDYIDQDEFIRNSEDEWHTFDVADLRELVLHRFEYKLTDDDIRAIYATTRRDMTK